MYIPVINLTKLGCLLSCFIPTIYSLNKNIHDTLGCLLCTHLAEYLTNYKACVTRHFAGPSRTQAGQSMFTLPPLTVLAETSRGIDIMHTCIIFYQ